MNKIFEEVTFSKYGKSWPHKGESCFYTTPEFVQDIPKLIREFDPVEYDEYAPEIQLDQSFAVFGYLKEIKPGEYLLEGEGHTVPHGKFSLDVEEFIKFCESKGVPVHVEVHSG